MDLSSNKTDIKIKGVTYIVKIRSNRAIFMWEDLSGKLIQELKSTEDQVMYAYCLLKSCNENFNYSYDEFIDLTDDNEKIIVDIYTFILKKKMSANQ